MKGWRIRVAAGMGLLLSSPLVAQVPLVLNHQGRVTVGGVPFNGAGQFKFALVNGDASQVYWRSAVDTSPADGQPDTAVSLTVNKGLYSVGLGDTAVMLGLDASMLSHPDVRLRVWFNDGTHGVQLLAPDERLGSVPYAVVAATVADGAVTSAKMAPSAVGSGQLANDGNSLGKVSGGALTVAGNDVTLPAGNLLAPFGSVVAANFYGGNINPDSQDQNDGALYPGLSFGLSSGEGIASKRTPGGNRWGLDFYTAFQNRMTIGGDGRVGIGTVNPAEKLEVNGTVKATAFTGDGSGLTGIPASAVAPAPPGMVLIPAGTFTMGDTLDGNVWFDAAPINVTVSAFYLDVHEVSWSQWQSVYYWAKEHGYTDLAAGDGKGANHPVQTVNWYDCVKWCNARSEQAGKPPVYYTDAGLTAVYRTGEVPVFAKWTAKGYRLPTEAEWEKAARGGVSGQRFPWGDKINQNLANYIGAIEDLDLGYAYDLGPNGYNAIGSVGGTSPATSPVGSFAPNGYGLNDMAGNVWEWCWDWYGTPYAGGTDPRGPASGSNRVVRGGGWYLVAIFCRSAYRYFDYPVYRSYGYGFRSALPPGQP